jgi:hypothetical protein
MSMVVGDVLELAFMSDPRSSVVMSDIVVTNAIVERARRKKIAVVGF